MHRFLTGLAAFLWMASVAEFLAAQTAKTEAKPVEGTLVLGQRTYKIAHAVAFEMNRGDEACIAILASDRKIPLDVIEAKLKKDPEGDENLSLDQPHVVVLFRQSGEPASCYGAGDATQFSRSGASATAQCRFEKERAIGQARLPLGDDAIVKIQFEFRWDIPLGLVAAAKPAPKPAGPVKPSVTGTFKGNGKQAKLAYVSARPGEPFADKPSIVLVFTEKDHSRDPKPDFKAGFGEYGSALIISVHENGNIFGCEVAHAAHGKMPFSSSGTIRTAAFEIGDGFIEGEIVTDGEQKFFEKTWEVDLKFVAAYAAPPAGSIAGKADKPKSADTSAKPKPVKKSDPDDDDDDDDEDARAKPAAALNVKDLALPKDASDIGYKKLVEQMTFKSAVGIEALAVEFSKKLAAQGWKTDKGGDLVNARTAILHRTRGGATLTIFVKPADKGSQVTIMTKGLDWGDKK